MDLDVPRYVLAAPYSNQFFKVKPFPTAIRQVRKGSAKKHRKSEFAFFIRCSIQHKKNNIRTNNFQTNPKVIDSITESYSFV